MKNKKISKSSILIPIGGLIALCGAIIGVSQFSKNQIFLNIYHALVNIFGPIGYWFLVSGIFLLGLFMIFAKPLFKVVKKANKRVKENKENRKNNTNENNEIISTSDEDFMSYSSVRNEEIAIEKPIEEEKITLQNENSEEISEYRKIDNEVVNTIDMSTISKQLSKARFNFDDDQLRTKKEIGSTMHKINEFNDPSAYLDEEKNDFSNTPAPSPSIDEAKSMPSDITNVASEEKLLQPEQPILSNAIYEEVKPSVEINNIQKQEVHTNEVKIPEPAKEPEVDFLHRPQPKAVKKPPFILPPLTLLDLHEANNNLSANEDSCSSRVEIINKTFLSFKVGASVVSYDVGPSVTRFDIQTNPDVSVNQVARYINDISVRLNGVPCRFEPIVLGKPTSGLEIPNETRLTVGLRESIEKLPPVTGDKNLFALPFGKNISGQIVQANLNDFPHMLVAGTTGSGKSIFVHSVIMTFLMRNTPDQLKLVLIDPKKVEMTYYHDIPHLLCPTICEPRQAYVAFKKLVDEMERRYNLFQTNGVRDIGSFNKFANQNGLQPLPTICVFVDEYADLNDQCKEIREPVVRIAQKARAAGIHMVIATQRPSVNVIDGVIKSNIPVHVALMVASQIDSMTIIGEGSAADLLDHGDMLVECSIISRANKPRVQGCFVDTSEINKVCDYLRSNYSTDYDPNFMNLEEKEEVSSNDEGVVTQVDAGTQEEELYEIIKGDIVTKQYCSISYIQRTYGVGFPKAGRLFNKLLKDGYVSSEHDARGSKVLIHQEVNTQSVGSVEQSTFVPNADIEPQNSEN